MKTLNKQKIAILGSGLTGKAIAMALLDLNLSVDLIEQVSAPKNHQSNVTLSISDASLKILQNLGVKKTKSNFWPLQKIILFDGLKKESKPDTEFYNLNQKKNLSHIVKRNILEKEINKKLKKANFIKNKISYIEDRGFLKKIFFQNKKTIEYNLIIATEFSNLKLLSNEKKLNWDYSETAYTFVFHHKKLLNNCARQFFLKDGPLAFLPISNTKTSVVWSVKNKSNAEKIILNYDERLNFLKMISVDFYDVTGCTKKLEKFGLTFEFLRKTALSRVIFMGDITHKIHPIAGQGWNMTLRDIDILGNILKTKLNKGYDVGDFGILKDFERKTKASNLLFAVSIDLIRKVFRSQSPAISKLRKKSFSIVSQPTVMNKIIDLADKGLRF